MPYFLDLKLNEGRIFIHGKLGVRVLVVWYPCVVLYPFAQGRKKEEKEEKGSFPKNVFT